MTRKHLIEQLAEALTATASVTRIASILNILLGCEDNDALTDEQAILMQDLFDELVMACPGAVELARS